MSWTKDLLGGLATYLAAQGVGVWDEAGTTGNIFRGPLPDLPDTAIGLTAYGSQDNVTSYGLADLVQPVQFLLRAPDQDGLDALGDAVYDQLQDAEHLVLGGVDCPLIQRFNDIPVGPDGSGRLLHSHNYHVQALRPTAHRS